MVHRKQPERKSLKAQLHTIDRRVAELQRAAAIEAAGIEHIPRGAPAVLRQGPYRFPEARHVVTPPCASDCPACAIQRRYLPEVQRLNAEELRIRALLAERERSRPGLPDDRRHVGEPKADVAAVLRAIDRGEKHEVIAREFGISVRTVGNYVLKYRRKG